jgi:hypothetical protein
MPTHFKTSIISIKTLAKLAKINYFSLYQRQRGKYKSELPLDMKTKVVNALIKDITPLVNYLGFEITISRKGT